jgi:dephospho-CoA kinase
MARDSVDRPHAQTILRAQASRTLRLALADDVIDNGGNLTELQEQVEFLHKKYLALAAA